MRFGCFCCCLSWDGCYPKAASEIVPLRTSDLYDANCCGCFGSKFVGDGFDLTAHLEIAEAAIDVAFVVAVSVLKRLGSIRCSLCYRSQKMQKTHLHQ